MRYFMDTEFIEDGKTIDLISIGIVAADGRELYLESSECDLTKANAWVTENVIPQLTGQQVTRSQMKLDIYDFVWDKTGTSPEFWGYYADYDWVALCQLFGRMIDLPITWPMYCRDLKQEMDQYPTFVKPNDPEDEHHALADAKWNKQTYLALEEHISNLYYDAKDMSNRLWHYGSVVE